MLAPGGQVCPSTDIVFVLDQSGSIGWPNFDRVKEFVSRLVGRLDIDSGNVRVGLVTYSTRVSTGFNLSDYNRVASVQSAISSIRYEDPRGTTSTDLALAHVRTSMLTSAAGDRYNAPNVVIVLTDGESNNFTATKVSKIRRSFTMGQGAFATSQI